MKITKNFINKVKARLIQQEPWETDLQIAMNQVAIIERREFIEKQLKVLFKYAPRK